MATSTERRADRLSRAVADGDDWAADDLFERLTKVELRELATELARRAGPSDTSMDQIRSAAGYAARLFNTTPDDILSGSRRREATEARQVTCYAARLLGCSYPTIGRQLGRDHTTVMHACTHVGETPRLRLAGVRIAERLGYERDVA